MVRIVQWANNEQITLGDMNDIGVSTRETFDYLTADAIDSTLKFGGFPINKTSNSSVTVGAGRLYKGGQMFSNEDSGGVALNLLAYLPSTNGNTKYVSVLSYANQADSNSVPRTFLINSATNQVEANNISTQNVRKALVAPAVGAEAPSPNPPPVSADQCEVARILLDVNGIVSIVYVEANRMKTVTGLDARAASLEDWRTKTGAQIDTLRSDIANIASSLIGLPSPAIFGQIVNTLAQVQNKAAVPANALNFHFDPLLAQTTDNSDFQRAGFLCNVDEGVRFPWAAQALSPLLLFNPVEPKVKPNSQFGLMLPDYTESARIDVIGNDGTLSLSQYQFQNLANQTVSISRDNVKFGNSFTVCQNSLFWSQGTYDPISHIFTRNGETYKVLGSSPTIYGPGHRMERLEKYWTSTMIDTYTTAVVVPGVVNGAVKAQTFLNSQAGWITSIELAFGQVDPNISITMLVTGTTNGAPDPMKVLSSVTVAGADLKVWPQTTKFPLKPFYADPGERYGIIVVSPGNHSICYVNGNKYAQGSLFDSTDNAFFQGDLTKDLAIRINYAKFTAPIIQLQMTPLQLQNGITDISMTYGAKVPDGCDLIWEIQVNGVWYAMKSYGTGAFPLLGLPPLLPLRLTMVGTTDLMPGIDMTQTQTLVSRPGAAFQHYTPPINIGSPSQNIRVTVTVDYFDTLHHTNGCTLIVNNAVVNPSTVSTAADPTRSVRFLKTYTFALGAATNSIVIGINGTTDTVTSVYHVESRLDYES